MRSLRIGSLPFQSASGKAQTLLVVADAGDAILAPVIGARARLIVGKVVPSVAVLAVVLPYGSPLALAEIGPPQLPRSPGLPALLKARLFRRPGAIDDWRLGHRRFPPTRAQQSHPPSAAIQNTATSMRMLTQPFRSCGSHGRTSTRSDRGMESVGDTFVSAALLNRERQPLEINGMKGLSPVAALSSERRVLLNGKSPDKRSNGLFLRRSNGRFTRNWRHWVGDCTY